MGTTDTRLLFRLSYSSGVPTTSRSNNHAASCSKCYSGYSGYSPLLAVRVVGIFRLSAEKEESTHAIEKINAGAAMSIRSDAILLAHLTKVSARLWRTRVYLHVCRSTAVG